jgi:hypothetical protein
MRFVQLLLPSPLLPLPYLSVNLANIKSKFGAISSTITRLEAVGAQLCDSLQLVQGAERQTGQVDDRVADRVKFKLKNVLFRKKWLLNAV